MLDSDMNAFRDDPVPDLLVDNDADGPVVHVENAASPAVVVFVGHALVDGPIDHNIHDIANLVGGKGSGDVNGSVLLESLSELVSGSSSLPVAVSHL